MLLTGVSAGAELMSQRSCVLRYGDHERKLGQAGARRPQSQGDVCAHSDLGGVADSGVAVRADANPGGGGEHAADAKGKRDKIRKLPGLRALSAPARGCGSDRVYGETPDAV